MRKFGQRMRGVKLMLKDYGVQVIPPVWTKLKQLKVLTLSLMSIEWGASERKLLEWRRSLRRVIVGMALGRRYPNTKTLKNIMRSF